MVWARRWSSSREIRYRKGYLGKNWGFLYLQISKVIDITLIIAVKVKNPCVFLPLSSRIKKKSKLNYSGKRGTFNVLQNHDHMSIKRGVRVVYPLSKMGKWKRIRHPTAVWHDGLRKKFLKKIAFMEKCFICFLSENGPDSRKSFEKNWNVMWEKMNVFKNVIIKVH